MEKRRIGAGKGKHLIVGNALGGNDHRMTHRFGRRAEIFSWCLYDWANSAFPAVVSTFVFAVYFTENVAQSPISGSVTWSLTVTASGLAIALTSPIAGAIADQTGRRKTWLIAFTVINIAACAMLWFVEPTTDHIARASLTYAVAATAFGLAMVFYDSMLGRLARPASIGKLSGIGWAFGYFGGLVCLLIVLYGFVDPGSALIELDRDRGEHVRVSTLFVASWYLLFSLPLFVTSTGETDRSMATSEAIRTGLGNLLGTVRNLTRQPVLGRFLIAHMFAADGVTTLILFGGVYASGTFGFEISEILTFAIVLYITAGIGAAVFGWLDDRIGPKAVIMIALTAILILVAGLALAGSKDQFWTMGTMLGFFIGPVQAASRSLMARLTPRETAAEMFGLYALAGKVTVFVGPLLFGLLTEIAQSQRAGFIVIILFLAAGLFTIRPLRIPPVERG